MDTSILSTLFEIAPDLMEEIELRTLILERVAALGPIGRRALAARLHLAEREVRAAADALKASGCITQSAAGMALTERGRSLAEAARKVSRNRRSLASLESALSRKLGVERVCVVHGDADYDETVREDAARALAREIRFLLQDARVLAVSGGRLLAQAAQEIAIAAPMDVTVVAAQGGVGGSVLHQANAVAERMAENLGGQCRALYLPDGVSAQMAEELSRIAQVREALDLLRSADVLLYEVRCAVRKGANVMEREALVRSGAAGETLGLYLDDRGLVVGGRSLPPLRAQDLGRQIQTAAIAVGGSHAEAIVGVCMHHPHRLLVTDEGAAQRITELLRV